MEEEEEVAERLICTYIIGLMYMLAQITSKSFMKVPNHAQQELE